MLYFDTIDVPEDVDINNANASMECVIYFHWKFLDKEPSFQSSVFNDCTIY